MPGGAHRRHNPLLDEWVLVSPQRLERPWQGGLEASTEEDVPPYDPACYLCPGNLRAGGARNPAYAATFAFDNDYAALLPEASAAGLADGLLLARPERGRCRVLCFTPRHDLSLARMDQEAVRGVVDLLAEETRALEAQQEFAYVLPFENRGAAMGCSNPHPHAQVWATAHVPTLPARKAERQHDHHRRHGRDLLGDYLDQEARAGTRVVCANEEWVALVPFWAVWPYETMLLPRRRVDSLSSLAADGRAALADVLRRMAVRYDNLFACPFPYSLAWHGRPRDGSHPGWRLHATWLPPLLRSATVRKFLVGYELAGEPQRDLTPEEAAERLRATSERHHRASPDG
jgi:UDPglucose--hexose-1-phosphate uridylyltransferase